MTLIDQAVIEQLDSFEALADAARAVSQDMDAGRWTLGDIANCCARKWGENTIGDLAAEIRIASKKTLYQYAQVSARFDVSTRVAYQDAPLTFSHFRAAMMAKDDAELWLAKAADEGWPVATLAAEIKKATGRPVPPTLIWSGEAVVIDQAFGLMTLRTDADVNVGMGQKVTVKIYAEAE